MDKCFPKISVCISDDGEFGDDKRGGVEGGGEDAGGGQGTDSVACFEFVDEGPGSSFI